MLRMQTLTTAQTKYSTANIIGEGLLIAFLLGMPGIAWYNAYSQIFTENQTAHSDLATVSIICSLVLLVSFIISAVHNKQLARVEKKSNTEQEAAFRAWQELPPSKRISVTRNGHVEYFAIAETAEGIGANLLLKKTMF